MGDYTGTIMTDAGLEWQADVDAGLLEPVFTKAVMGTGIPPDDFDPTQMTELIEPRRQCASLGVGKRGKQVVHVETVFDNRDLGDGFYVREIGLFARGKDGEDMLIAVSISGTKPDFMPTIEDGSLVESAHNFLIVVGRAENVTVDGGDLTSLVPRSEFEELKAEYDVHHHPPSDIDGLEEWMEENSGSFIHQEEKGAPGGVAMLDDEGKLPLDQLPGGGDAESVNGIKFRVQGGLLQFSADGETWQNVPAVYQ